MQLSEALLQSFIIGAALSLVAFVIAWCVLFADFRVRALEARRGIWRFERAPLQIADASTFVGLQVCVPFYRSCYECWSATMIGCLASVYRVCQRSCGV
jgi:hypothetical protein